MNIKATKKLGYVLLTCVAIIIGIIYFFLNGSMLKCKDTQYIYIDKDDIIDSVVSKLSANANSYSIQTFKKLANHNNYSEHIKTGRYEIKPGKGALSVFRQLRNGIQTPIRLTIPPVRTIEQLSGFLGKKLMADSTAFYNALIEKDLHSKYELDSCNIICMFVPNTYDVYWNIDVEKFFDKMNKEYKKFWNENRLSKASSLNLSPTEVMALASIVDEETANNAEKPTIAGMYYNRLKINMPLQADPTVKYALKQFELKRIYQSMLTTDNPYNTYRYKGLPPGPIRIPTIEGIEAVLNLQHHDYLYMCAKEDFSGKHNFAKTLAEHQQNANKYYAALNARGIK